MRSALIFNFLIEANIMASIAILLMIPLRKLLRKQIGNTAICFGWMLAALRLLIPLTLPNPLIHEIRPTYLSDVIIRPIAGQVKVRTVDAIGDLGRIFWQAGNRQAYADLQKIAVGVDYNGYPEILAWVWLSGCLLVLLWFIYKNVQFRTALKKNRIEDVSGELKEIYLQLCKERKVRPVPVYFTDPVPGACLVGVFRPYIVLPLMTAPQDVKNVLTHEICHMRNRDHIWGVLRLFCCAIHWFNPLVWLAAAMSRTDCELRCDDRVTAPMNETERKDYANVLVLAAARRSMPGLGVMATGMTMTGKRLKTRIMTVLQGHKPIQWLIFVFAGIASVCLICSFATSELPDQAEFGVSIYDEGRYLTEALSGNQDIRSEREALDYARSLWERIRANRIDGDYSVYRQEDGSWFVTMAADEKDLFSVFFQRNGVIEDIAQNVDDDRWLTDGEYVESTEMDALELAEVERWAAAMLEDLTPGLLNELQEFQLAYVRDVENAQYLFLRADPKSGAYDAGINMFIRFNTDHSCNLLMLQLSGNG